MATVHFPLMHSVVPVLTCDAFDGLLYGTGLCIELAGRAWSYCLNVRYSPMLCDTSMSMVLAGRAWAFRRARRSLKPAAGTGQRCCELSGPPARCEHDPSTTRAAY